MTTSLREAAADPLPPIVLLIEDDRDTLDMYSSCLESAGLWVATATNPIAGQASARELRPNLIVTDIGFGGASTGVDLVHQIKADPLTSDIPVIVLSGTALEDLPSETQREVELVLLKPVLPDELLGRARALLAKTGTLRARSDVAVKRAHSLLDEHVAAVKRGRPYIEQLGKGALPCPKCGTLLEWIERGTVGGIEYDYYRWCLKGCGLFCYDCRATHWIKLAG